MTDVAPTKLLWVDPDFGIEYRLEDGELAYSDHDNVDELIDSLETLVIHLAVELENRKEKG